MPSVNSSASMNGSISLIIPYWNGKKYIHDALLSVSFETVKPKEVIIIDDGSTCEDSIRVLDNIGQYYNLNIVVERQLNTGQGGARNYGVKIATSEFIAFLDQDDMSLPWKNKLLLSSLVKAYKKDPLCAYATADAMHVNEAGQTVMNNILSRLRKAHPKTDIIDYLSYDVFQLPGATLFRRDIFLAVGGFDPRLAGYEDDDLFTKIYRAGYSSVSVDMEVMKWRINDESTSYSPRMIQSRNIYAQKLLQEYQDDFFLGRFYTSVINRRFLKAIRNQAVRDCLLCLKRPTYESMNGALLSFQLLTEYLYSLREARKDSRRRYQALSGKYVVRPNLGKSARALSCLKLSLSICIGLLLHPLRSVKVLYILYLSVVKR